MKILAIDTSGPVCGVAVMQGDQILYEAAAQNKLTHSVNLMPMVDAALSAAGLGLAEMDRLAVVTGPGSFTGVRIGVSTVKGLAHGAEKPCVAVDALEAMAMGAGEIGALICPMQDARAGQVYGAAFQWQNGKLCRVMEDTPLKLEEYAQHVLSFGKKCYLMGDGMAAHREKLMALFGQQGMIAPPHMAYLRPGSVAVLARDAVETLDYQTLMPMYLRAPSAQRNRKLVEAMENA